MRALKQVSAKGRHQMCLVTTQAHEGIETTLLNICFIKSGVTTQAHEGIETAAFGPAACNPEVTTQAHEGIETSFSHRSIWDTPVTT